MLKFSLVISTWTKSFVAKLLYKDNNLLIVTLTKISFVKAAEHEEFGEKQTRSPIRPNAPPSLQSMRIKY